MSRRRRLLNSPICRPTYLPTHAPIHPPTHPRAELGRPRIDVVCNLSGIFRDSFQNVVELLDDLFQVGGWVSGWAFFSYIW